MYFVELSQIVDCSNKKFCFIIAPGTIKLNRVTRTIVNVRIVQFVSDELAQLDDGIHFRFNDQTAAIVQDG